MKGKNNLEENRKKLYFQEKKLKNLIFSYKFAFSILYSVILTFILFFNYSPQVMDYKVGDIAKKDIKAPFDFKVINKEATERIKIAELKKAPYVYDYIPNAKDRAQENINRLFKYFVSPRKNRKKIEDEFGISLSKVDLNILSRRSTRTKLEKIVISILDNLYKKDIIRDKNKLLSEGKSEAIITKGNTRSTLKLSETWGDKEIKEFIYTETKKKNLKKEEIALIEQIIFSVYSPEYLKNETKTKVYRENTAKNLTPVYNIIKKGRMIVRNGDELDEKTCDILRKLKSLQAQKKKPFSLIGSSFLFILLIVFISSLILDSLKRRYLSGRKIIHIVFANLVFYIALYRSMIMLIDFMEKSGVNLSMLSNSTIHFLIPFQSGGIILALLVGFEISIVFIFLMSIIAGVFLVKNYYLVIFIMISSLIPVLKTRGSREIKRSLAIKLSLYYVLPTTILFIIFENILAKGMGVNNIFSYISAFIGAILVSIFVTAFIPFEESVFKLISDLKLLELTNLDLPLFREMALKAYGTYHHSLMVASLAEQAAKDIGINPVVVRCQALYHDIGKMKRPNYFVENIPPNEENIHNKLPPLTSVVYIKNHVSDGVEIANKYGLPEVIKDGIREHHGTSLITFFYNKELERRKKEAVSKKKEEVEEIKIDEEAFRYQGPKPQTRETALLMLADSVEAAAKSLTEMNETVFRNLIDKIFKKVIDDGQLNESDLSFKDIQIISESFYETLVNLYHGRISYPGFNFNEGKENGNNNK